MNQTSHTAELPPASLGPADRSPARGDNVGARAGARVSPWHGALLLVIALEGVLDFRRLRQNGYANIFYSAGVRSELHSWHNFLFASFDPGGLISVDKPPLGIWLQVASAKLFGFSPLSLLAPEAVAGMLTVVALYLIVSRRFGAAAGVVSALALAVFPSFVAVSRDNGVDPLLILFMTLSCGAAMRAAESGRLRWLLAWGVMVGLAFNTKTLAALLVIPGGALAYLVCAQLSLVRRLGHLLIAGGLAVVVSGAWIAFVDLTPATQRPFVGSSTNNTEVNLTFSYNGVGRVNGQVGGPGRVPHVGGPVLPPSNQAVGSTGPSKARPTHPRARAPARPPRVARLHRPVVRHAPAPVLPRASSSGVEPIPRQGHARFPSVFGGPTGPLRLYSDSLGGQDAWLLPFSLVGLLAVALTVRGRTDRRLSGLLVLGGWFLCEGLVLSFSKGIVHPYYVSALGPGVAAMCGAGAWAMVALAQRVDWRLMLPPLAVAVTAYGQFVLLRREHYLQPLLPVLGAMIIVGILVMLVRQRWAAPAMALALAALVIAPTAYASTVWNIPVEGTFPAAGPHVAAGHLPLAVGQASVDLDLRLLRYLAVRQPGSRWVVLADAADTAAPMILLGHSAGAMGGYSGTDPAVDGPALAQLVNRGEARYVLLGGAYSGRGGNRGTRAVALACPHIPSLQWRGVPGGAHSLALLDCRGRGAALSAAG